MTAASSAVTPSTTTRSTASRAARPSGRLPSVAVTISGNDVYANRTGIFVTYGSQAGGNGGYTISGNQIHGNTDTDINLTSSFRNSVALNNTVYGAPIGINLGGVAEAKGTSSTTTPAASSRAAGTSPTTGSTTTASAASTPPTGRRSAATGSTPT